MSQIDLDSKQIQAQEPISPPSQKSDKGLFFVSSGFLFSIDSHNSQQCVDEIELFNRKYQKGADTDQIPQFMDKMSKYYSNVRSSTFDRTKNIEIQAKVQKYNNQRCEVNSMGRKNILKPLIKETSSQIIQWKAKNLFQQIMDGQVEAVAQKPTYLQIIKGKLYKIVPGTIRINEVVQTSNNQQLSPLILKHKYFSRQQSPSNRSTMINVANNTNNIGSTIYNNINNGSVLCNSNYKLVQNGAAQPRTNQSFDIGNGGPRLRNSYAQTPQKRTAIKREIEDPSNLFMTNIQLSQEFASPRTYQFSPRRNIVLSSINQYSARSSANQNMCMSQCKNIISDCHQTLTNRNVIFSRFLQRPPNGKSSFHLLMEQSQKNQNFQKYLQRYKEYVQQDAIFTEKETKQIIKVFKQNHAIDQQKVKKNNDFIDKIQQKSPPKIFHKQKHYL